MVFLIFLFFLCFSQPVFSNSDVATTDVPDDIITTPIPATTPEPNVTSTPILTPIPTSINTPPPITTTVNPESGIILSEFMPYSSIEWIEIYNDNDKEVELKNWKIKNKSSGTKVIPDIKISPKSYDIFEFSKFLDDSTDKIILINNNDQIVTQYEYPDNKITLERSWSFINNGWCQANITQNKINETSCYSPSIPLHVTTIPTTIPTSNNLYKADTQDFEPAINDPVEESPFNLSPTEAISPLSSKLVLGENTTTVKKNNYPIIFIFIGSFLFVTPFILDKIKKR